MNELLAPFLVVMHGVVAGLVTMHVLLTHRDVRSAIGWIGLSWLSPFLGSSIYFAFGINRVARRGASYPLVSDGTGPLDAEAILGNSVPKHLLIIARAGDGISGLSLTRGNKIELYCDGDEAYPPMLEAIGRAKHSVALASYIFAHDRSGKAFVDALIAARERGCEVRVLIDGIGGGYFRSGVIRDLRAAGVSAEQFLHQWFPWQMPFINLRNHKKLLIIDGETGFTGGINISDWNVGGGGLPRIRDSHARLHGPVVAHLMDTFVRDWAFTTEERLEGDAWRPGHQPEPKSSAAAVMRGVSSGPDEHIGRAEALLASAIEQAEERIRIVTPYFLPEDRLVEVLRRAALRGVPIELLVPRRTNHFYVTWAMQAHMATFPLHRVTCHLSGDPFDHSKLMTVDGNWCAFGSPNWDARSLRLNFEFLVECYDRDVTGRMDAIIDAKMEGTTRLTADILEARNLPVKLRDASARLLLPYL